MQQKTAHLRSALGLTSLNNALIRGTERESLRNQHFLKRYCAGTLLWAYLPAILHGGVRLKQALGAEYHQRNFTHVLVESAQTIVSA